MLINNFDELLYIIDRDTPSDNSYLALVSVCED